MCEIFLYLYFVVSGRSNTYLQELNVPPQQRYNVKSANIYIHVLEEDPWQHLFKYFTLQWMRIEQLA